MSRKGQARSSVRRALAPVKAMLADAHEDGLIRFNPTAGARILPPVRQDEEAVQRVKALAPDELAAVIEHTPPEWRLFVMFLAETGLRIGEAIEVRWSDVDRGNRRLTVARQRNRGAVSMPKGRKTRVMPLSRQAERLLWEHRKQTKAADGDLVFVGRLGAPVEPGNLSERMLKPTCVAAGLGEMVAANAAASCGPSRGSVGTRSATPARRSCSGQAGTRSRCRGCWGTPTPGSRSAPTCMSSTTTCPNRACWTRSGGSTSGSTVDQYKPPKQAETRLGANRPQSPFPCGTAPIDRTMPKLPTWVMSRLL